MSEMHPPSDDELVSAYLDGELGPADRVRVEDDPALRARLEQFRRVADSVAEPVSPPSGPQRDAAIARALATQVPAPSPTTGVIDLAAERQKRRGRQRVLTAAAVVLMVVGAIAVTRLDGPGGDGSDSALEAQTSDDDASASAESEVASGGGGAESGDLFGFAARVDLGAVSDDDELRSLVTDQLGPAAAEAAPFAAADDGSAATDAGDEALEADDTTDTDVSDQRATAGEGEERISEDCEIALAETNPDLAGQLLQATAVYEGEDAVVYVYNAPGGGQRLFVLALPDCRELTSFRL